MDDHKNIDDDNVHEEDVCCNEGIPAVNDEDYECGETQDGGD